MNSSNDLLIFTGTPTRARTVDPQIKSLLLYQLSYGCIFFSIIIVYQLMLFVKQKKVKSVSFDYYNVEIIKGER